MSNFSLVRITRTLLGGAVGFIACSVILQKLDPLMAQALTQVLALLSLENGVFLAAISLTYGIPLMVELGIFFDVLVGVMVLGILIYRIRESFESMDVSRLRRLRG